MCHSSFNRPSEYTLSLSLACTHPFTHAHSQTHGCTHTCSLRGASLSHTHTRTLTHTLTRTCNVTTTLFWFHSFLKRTRFQLFAFLNGAARNPFSRNETRFSTRMLKYFYSCRFQELCHTRILNRAKRNLKDINIKLVLSMILSVFQKMLHWLFSLM